MGEEEKCFLTDQSRGRERGTREDRFGYHRESSEEKMGTKDTWESSGDPLRTSFRVCLPDKTTE